MTYVENLIRLYYLYHGDFHNIRNCNFFDLVNKSFSESNYDSLINYLYSVVGYKNTNIYPSTEVQRVRRDFCVNSYKKAYLSKMVKDYKCGSISELVDLLEMRGMLGIERKHLSDLGDYTDTGIPKRFLNLQIKEVLEVIETYLDKKSINNNLTFLDLKMDLLVKDSVKESLKEYKLTPSHFFSLKYDPNTKYPYVKDDTVYMKPNDKYSEDEIRETLVICYCMGLPKLPVYLRKEFISLLPRVMTFNSYSDSLLRMIDISYVCEVSVRQLLEVFGLSLPDPEVMWKKFNGYLTYYDKVLYSNSSSNSFIEFEVNDFLNCFNKGELENLDINMELVYQENKKMKKSNSFSD